MLTAEWYPQSGIQITWPHAGTDWSYMLEEVQSCFIRIAKEIAERELLLIVTPEPAEVERQLAGIVNREQLRIFCCNSNDTWTRDHSAITLINSAEATLLDFTFNGWGLKFPANHDNRITKQLIDGGALRGRRRNCLNFVLEGGAIESDGAGTLLTTARCLLSPNRNDSMSRAEIAEQLRQTLHLQRILWLEHGYLAGDDTDSHIDTLARFCAPDTLAYIKCTDKADEHYAELQAMEKELQAFRTLAGTPYRLLPLPMADPIIEAGERLPASYANFLIINSAVLYPTYRQPRNDEQAKQVLQTAFPQREVVGIDCLPLIRQHGSLHCVTMQYPLGVIA